MSTDGSDRTRCGVRRGRSREKRRRRRRKATTDASSGTYSGMSRESGASASPRVHGNSARRRRRSDESPRRNKRSTSPMACSVSLSRSCNSRDHAQQDEGVHNHTTPDHSGKRRRRRGVCDEEDDRPGTAESHATAYSEAVSISSLTSNLEGTPCASGRLVRCDGHDSSRSPPKPDDAQPCEHRDGSAPVALRVTDSDPLETEATALRPRGNDESAASELNVRPPQRRGRVLRPADSGSVGVQSRGPKLHHRPSAPRDAMHSRYHRAQSHATSDSGVGDVGGTSAMLAQVSSGHVDSRAGADNAGCAGFSVGASAHTSGDMAAVGHSAQRPAYEPEGPFLPRPGLDECGSGVAPHTVVEFQQQVQLNQPGPQPFQPYLQQPYHPDPFMPGAQPHPHRPPGLPQSVSLGPAGFAGPVQAPYMAAQLGPQMAGPTHTRRFSAPRSMATAASDASGRPQHVRLRPDGRPLYQSAAEAHNQAVAEWFAAGLRRREEEQRRARAVHVHGRRRGSDLGLVDRSIMHLPLFVNGVQVGSGVPGANVPSSRRGSSTSAGVLAMADDSDDDGGGKYWL